MPHSSANPGISVLTLVSLNRPRSAEPRASPDIRIPGSLRTTNFILSIQT